MINVIVSHDVDHLFRSDHYTDLIYPKLWIRETLSFLRGQLSPKEWLLRMASPFKTERHNIFDVMTFDKKYGVPSTFFFGMSQGLGMSYKKELAFPIIKQLASNGFDVGVHGIAHNDYERIQIEYNDFMNIGAVTSFGIREHYVRFTKDTFKYLEKAGYLFDSSEFDKTAGYLIKSPYKVGAMWEFPLSIMDGYLPCTFAEKKKKTLIILEEAKRNNCNYVTILFHDYLYCSAYKEYKEWYEWIIKYIYVNNEYAFLSYKEAIANCNMKINVA